jgi:membrane-associated phospholipid phosphatase
LEQERKHKKESWLEIWKATLKHNSFKWELAVSAIVVYATLHFFSIFLLFAEDRPGVVMFDPILDLYSAIDLSLPIFFLTYVVLLAALIALSYYPRCFIIALQSYTVMVILRMISIYLTPIEAPVGIIVLHDPFFLMGTGRVILKDLFFSGHTATMFLLYLTAQNKKIKYLLLICTFLVGITILLQKVHYSVDVFIAPFMAYCSFKMVSYFHKSHYKCK